MRHPHVSPPRVTPACHPGASPPQSLCFGAQHDCCSQFCAPGTREQAQDRCRLGEGASRWLLDSATRNAGRRTPTAESGTCRGQRLTGHTLQGLVPLGLAAPRGGQRPGQLGPKRRVDLGRLTGFLRPRPAAPTPATHLSKVLLKMPELQTLLEFLLMLCPELIEGSLGLAQLGQEPGERRGSVCVGAGRAVRAPGSSSMACPHPRHLSPALDAGFAGPVCPRERHSRGDPAGPPPAHLIALGHANAHREPTAKGWAERVTS